MTRLLPLLALALLLAACGKPTGEMRAYLMQEGGWGWENGAGCEELTDAWVVHGDWIDMYEGGQFVTRAKLMGRDIRFEDGETYGAGYPSHVHWQIIAQDPENPARLGRHKIRFAVRGGPGRPTALVTELKRDFTDAETREMRRITDPRGGQRLVACPADQAMPALVSDGG